LYLCVHKDEAQLSSLCPSG